MRTAILGLVVGIACLQQQSALFDRAVLLLILLGLLCLSGLSLWRRVRPALMSSVYFRSHILRMCWRFLLGMGIGFCWAGLLAHAYLDDSLPAKWEGRDLEVIGVVDSLPAQSERGVQFNFRVENYFFPPAAGLVAQNDIVSMSDNFPQRLSLAWFKDLSQIRIPTQTQIDDLPNIKPGQRWHFKLRLKRPHGNGNPNGFDYEAWLLEQGLRATGTVRAEQGDNTRVNRKVDEFVFGIHNLIERGRYILQQKILVALPNDRFAGVISALVVGDQRDIAPADWTVFNRTGIGHLISISGLHITMIAGLFAGLMHFLWRHSFFTQAQLPLLVPAQKIAILAGVVVAVIYVALAGFGVPAQRTLWMLIVVAIALWCGRVADSTMVLSWALGLVVLIDPWAILWPGFWLSFAAVAVLLYVSTGRVSIAPGRVKSSSILGKMRPQLFLAAQTQYAITLGLVPLSLLLFGQISLLSPLANAVAIPLISFVVTPLALIGSLLPAPFAAPCLHVAHAGISILVRLLEWLSESPLAVWQTPLPTWWMFGLAIIGIAILLAPKGFPGRWIGIMVCIPIAIQPAHRPALGQMQVTVFDIGQGAAVLVETAHHRLLYDTGPGLSPEVNSASRILLPYFRSRGISAIDQLMISHSDNDHSGGALSILRNLQILKLSSSLPDTHPIVQAASQVQRCEAGQSWEWDGVRFEILHPVPVIYTSDKWKTNALSCTLKISTNTHALLLAGDIEAIQEDELINSVPEKLAANVLLAPHHGSGTSSTAAFLQAVKPELALFQVGYLNRYHHPKPEVMQRYLDFGIKPLRTDTSGAITLQFGSTIEVSAYRQQHKRYWYP